MIKITCHECSNSVLKPAKEINRQKRLGRKHFFCSLSCACSYKNSVNHSGAWDNPRHRKINLKTQGFKYVRIKALLKARNIKYRFEHYFEGYNYLFDLYLRDLNILIEFDGPEHREPKGLRKDKLKNNLAKLKNCRLIRIPVERNSVIPSKLVLPYLK